MDDAPNFCRGKLIPLLAIVGPTAAGKTEISIELAHRLGGEIISADSVQVYRYMDIGTAKPSVEERRGIPHYMIDIADPDTNFTVYGYQKKAQNCIAETYKRCPLQLLTAGTGLYIKSVIDDYVIRTGKVTPTIRRRLQEMLNSKGRKSLYGLLQKKDPAAARRIHPNDSRRIIRALEFFYMTGKPISMQRELTQKKQRNYQLTMVAITMDRKYLYERINKRVDLMIEKGLLQEVKGLLAKGYNSSLKSMQSLGYLHFINYLENKWDWETAISNLKRDTRRYAKRQLTWFRADHRILWYEREANNMKIEPILDNICLRMEGY